MDTEGFIEGSAMNLLHAILKRTPFSWVETPEGLKWHISDDLYVYHQVLNEYHFSDIGEDDLVIDIGANIGVFSILAARCGAQVLAVEPVMGDELKRNIRMNRIEHIHVLECALGKGGETEITWERRTGRVQSMTLSRIINQMGGCTFLKVDCEGGEWFIDPDELRSVRRIEMELHRKGEYRKYPSFMEGIRKYFRIDYDRSFHPTIFGIVHGYARKE
jgi:FkbM family methyltransferase